MRKQTEEELPGFPFSTTYRGKTADDLICSTELAVNSMAQRFRQMCCNEKMQNVKIISRGSWSLPAKHRTLKLSKMLYRGIKNTEASYGRFREWAAGL